jgi:hypothetical protein
MSVSLDITQGNTGRLADRKGPANLAAKLFPCALGYCSNNTDQFIKLHREMVTISRRFQKTTRHRVTENEKFRLQKYRNSSSFQSHPLQLSRSAMEPTGFDRHGPGHVGFSSRVVLPADLSGCAC